MFKVKEIILYICSVCIIILIVGLIWDLFLSFGCMSCGILAPPPGTEPVPCEVELQSLNHWTSREISSGLLKCWVCLQLPPPSTPSMFNPLLFLQISLETIFCFRHHSATWGSRLSLPLPAFLQNFLNRVPDSTLLLEKSFQTSDPIMPFFCLNSSEGPCVLSTLITQGSKHLPSLPLLIFTALYSRHCVIILIGSWVEIMQ